MFSTRSKKTDIPRTKTPPSHLRFVNNIALEKFDSRFYKRSVLSGKPINLASFAVYHIENLFVRLDWKVFLELSNLTQTFYANLTIDEDNIVYSRVGGIDVTLSADGIAHILALPSEGFDVFL